MKPLLKRRTVYAATVVGMLVVISGFTLASGLFGGFTGTNGSTVNGNQGSFTGGNTIYSAGLSGSMYWTHAGGSTGTCTASSSSGSASAQIVTAWVSGGSGSCTTTVDYILEVNFTSASIAASTYTDHFTISSEFGTPAPSGYTTSGVSIVCTITATGTCEASINIDTGIIDTATQPALDALQVTVTGN